MSSLFLQISEFGQPALRRMQSCLESDILSSLYKLRLMLLKTKKRIPTLGKAAISVCIVKHLQIF